VKQLKWVKLATFRDEIELTGFIKQCEPDVMR